MAQLEGPVLHLQSTERRDPIPHQVGTCSANVGGTVTALIVGRIGTDLRFMSGIVRVFLECGQTSLVVCAAIVLLYVCAYRYL